MENANQLALSEKSTSAAVEDELTQLDDLHLALVGGGIGDTILK